MWVRVRMPSTSPQGLNGWLAYHPHQIAITCLAGIRLWHKANRKFSVFQILTPPPSHCPDSYLSLVPGIRISIS